MSTLSPHTEHEPSLRIAIIDDHALFLQGLAYVFANAAMDLQADCFSSATEFFETLDAGQSYDVIITDLAMKQINGIALIRALRTRGNGVQVIVLSASEDATIRTTAETVGAFCFVHKSCEEAVLLEAVLAAHDKGPVHDRVMRKGLRRSVLQEDGTDAVIQPKLGPQQQRILAMMAEGRTNNEIALALAISENTVKTHAKSIFRELSVSSRAAAVQRARELALF